MMSKKMMARFNEVWHSGTEVEYDPAWEPRRLTDPFNWHLFGAVQLPVPEGAVWRSFDQVKHRKIIMVGSYKGTYVVYEEYSPGGPYSLVRPKTGTWVQCLVVKLTATELYEVVGKKVGCLNIGQTLA